MLKIECLPRPVTKAKLDETCSAYWQFSVYLDLTYYNILLLSNRMFTYWKVKEATEEFFR